MHASPPLIGITGRRDVAGLVGAPRGFADAPADIYFEEYASSVRRAGGLPVYIPLEVDAGLMLKRLDGLIISGGEDVDPALYGEEVGPRTLPGSGLRDRSEIALLRAAVAQDVPVLGICRGQQLINVAYGGTLVQHLDDERAEEPHFHGERHRAERPQEVRFEPGSFAHELYGERSQINSFHHQAVDRLGRGVQVVGRARDGVIEAIAVEGADVFATQWHPECFSGDPIFDRLVTNAQQARARRGKE